MRLVRRRMEEGETVVLSLPASTAPEPQAEEIPLSILYEDDSLIVVDKPAGLVVHPAPGNWSGTLVNALLAHCGDSLSGIGGVRRPGIVHRLDKDTSGIMVVAKNDVTHRGLAEQFAAHGADGRLERAYLALVWGVPARASGVIDAPLARATGDRTKREVARSERPDARHAVTHYHVKESLAQGAVALVECRLETGRTHQIRVHMTHLGHPLIGDETYGRGFRTKIGTLDERAQASVAAFRRQALHAFRLAFVHPESNEKLQFETGLPRDMQELVMGLRSSHIE
ncbi:ribosomal large subunit pseudouridine synthase D [Consotaella salsifontis]|uniref:Pseudouridine synthase n=1 Tax=Consotaella salsifontis TaxID=1365950 RepID=A0A1T4RDX6_9HYPH|nr:ribosomal large subunit pseudouridine synthase D [Consotaella salsifontis]